MDFKIIETCLIKFGNFLIGQKQVNANQEKVNFEIVKKMQELNNKVETASSLSPESVTRLEELLAKLDETGKTADTGGAEDATDQSGFTEPPITDN